jgi:NADH-quinone oxidoreductase subunit M
MSSDLLPQIELLLLLLLPLAGAIVVALRGSQHREAIRWISLATTVPCLVLALHLAWQFMSLPADSPPDKPKTLFQPRFVPGSPAIVKDNAGRDQVDPSGTKWTLLRLGTSAIQFYIGLDGMNVWLVVLTALLLVPSVLVSWEHIEERANEFYAWLLVLETGMLGVFVAFDIILFYAFFELTLVPLFFLIGIWGGPERRHAAAKFFIFTLTGSLITLLGVLGVVLACHAKSELTFSIPRLVYLVNCRLINVPDEQAFWSAVQFWVFLALFAGFAIKVPLVPVHTWLPLAHTEAPTAGSVLLAGVLLKIGSYGFLRLALPLAPDTSLTLGVPLISGLAAIGIVYGALCAYAQDDIKKMVAYSSVSHLGLCMLAMFALNGTGLSGSMMVMINHGLSTGLLFLLVGMLYERYHTRKMSDYGGMARRLPLLGACMVFVCLTSVGLPGLNGFIGEALAILGIVERHQKETPLLLPVYALAAVAGLVLGAWYLFTMLQRVFFGEVKEPAVLANHGHGAISDLKPREWFALAPLMAVCLFLGVWPQPVLQTMRPAVQVVEHIALKAHDRHMQAHRGPHGGFATTSKEGLVP